MQKEAHHDRFHGKDVLPFLTDGRCFQPVGVVDDTGACAVWDGERQSQGQGDWQTADNQEQHSRNLPTALSRL